ncbi:hypothetical protein T01_491 [Trichinella spiralis]|uniref:Uncharacterized protein n=1 Tax=Trichinella spiralis TaxID=6334 RepID=A0A0V1BU84_TRISP|nr:hypothetical protein T01_491 [Trichinella spiralis]
MVGVASVFSGFGLPVRVCCLWWKSSSARMTLLTRSPVPAAGSPDTPLLRLFPRRNAPRDHVLLPRLCVQFPPPPGRIVRWFGPRVGVGCGAVDQLPCRLLPAIRVQQSLLELFEGILSYLSCRVELAAD